MRETGDTNINPQPPILFQMATGYWLSQAIYVAAKLGLADLLKDGPKSCSALAAATGADEHSLFRLMRALSSAGVFAHLQNDSFALASAGESLQSNVPGSLRAIVMSTAKFITKPGEIFFIVSKPVLQHSTTCLELVCSGISKETRKPLRHSTEG